MLSNVYILRNFVGSLPYRPVGWSKRQGRGKRNSQETVQMSRAMCSIWRQKAMVRFGVFFFIATFGLAAQLPSQTGATGHGTLELTSGQMPKPAPWPVDEDSLPTKDFLNTLNTKAKWDNFVTIADERSQLHGFIHWTNVAYGEPK
jgi:hypothetical protein